MRFNLSTSGEKISPWVTLQTHKVSSPGRLSFDLYHSIKQFDYVSVLCITEEGLVPIVRQFRPALNTYTRELPSGLNESMEDPLIVAQRELFEETGYCSFSPFIFLGKFLPDTGRLDNTLWGFMCTNAFLSHNWVPEEDIDVELVSTTQLKYQIKSGFFASSIHISLVAKAMLLNLL